MYFLHAPLDLPLSSSLDSSELPMVPAVLLAFSSLPSSFSASPISFLEQDLLIRITEVCRQVTSPLPVA